MRKLVLALGLLLVGGATVFGQEMRMPINADDVKWGPAPTAFPARCFREPFQRRALCRSTENASQLQNSRS